MILKILEDNPMHGYEIMNEISLRTQGYWRPTAGSIYPALGSLEKDRYVERRELMQGERARQMYIITDLGRETIKDMSQFSESWKNGLNKLMGLL
ncbi:PadR family transcriptional regulator [Cuniculiplasma divulgatum]|uniref:PadR family transcriptional regulator n=1 Tax=Cuniculiplasma divulgatum TaxID=1673428 RepID=UPI0011E59B33|nr:PadR family transcriptional regulator [Cuniculiplasma divulgatum]